MNESENNSALRNIISQTGHPAFILLLLALAFGAFLRFYRLDSVPDGFTFDEAAHAMDAQDILSGQIMLNSDRLEQNPAGYMYLTAASFKLFGAVPWAQRAVSAFCGVVLILTEFLAMRALFSDEGRLKAELIGALSSFLLAVSFWAVITSRIGYEYICSPVCATLAVYFFGRGYRRQSYAAVAAAAFFSALGFYFYEASAPFILVIPLTMLAWRGICNIRRRETPAEGMHWRLLLFFTALSALLFLPLLLTFLTGQTPEADRSWRESLFGRSQDLPSLLDALLVSLGAHAQTFLGINGDQEWLTNIQGKPILPPFLGLSLLAGIIISLRRLKRWPYLLLLLYWAAMIAPAFLTFVAFPKNFRLSGAIPATFGLAALAITEALLCLPALLQRFLKQKPLFYACHAAGLLLFAYLLFYLPLQTYRDYFLTWAGRPEVALAHDVPIVRLIERIERENDSQAAFLLPRNANRIRHNYTIDFLYHGISPLIYINLKDKDELPAELDQKVSPFRTIYLITGIIGGREQDYSRVDPEGLLPQMLNQYGRAAGEETTDSYHLLIFHLERGR